MLYVTESFENNNMVILDLKEFYRMQYIKEIILVRFFISHMA